LPEFAWSAHQRDLLARSLNQGTLVLVAGLLLTVLWRDRRAWRRTFALKGEGLTRPTVLALTGLGMTFGLHALQATSVNASSIRYLVPVWIFRPGLLASGLRAWWRTCRIVALMLLAGGWTLGQVDLFEQLDRTHPAAPLAAELKRRK